MRFTGYFNTHHTYLHGIGSSVGTRSNLRVEQPLRKCSFV